MGFLASIERAFFAELNRLVEPRVREGWASPGLVPAGFVVLETRGRKTGERRRVPLAAVRLGGTLLVATFRGRRSGWIRNAAASPAVAVWIDGERHPAHAFVVFPGAASLPEAYRWLVPALAPWTCVGWAFALLEPEPALAAGLDALPAPARS